MTVIEALDLWTAVMLTVIACLIFLAGPDR